MSALTSKMMSMTTGCHREHEDAPTVRQLKLQQQKQKQQDQQKQKQFTTKMMAEDVSNDVFSRFCSVRRSVATAARRTTTKTKTTAKDTQKH